AESRKVKTAPAVERFLYRSLRGSIGPKQSPFQAGLLQNARTRQASADHGTIPARRKLGAPRGRFRSSGLHLSLDCGNFCYHGLRSGLSNDHPRSRIEQVALASLFKSLQVVLPRRDDTLGARAPNQGPPHGVRPPDQVKQIPPLVRRRRELEQAGMKISDRRHDIHARRSRQKLTRVRAEEPDTARPPVGRSRNLRGEPDARNARTVQPIGKKIASNASSGPSFKRAVCAGADREV